MSTSYTKQANLKVILEGTYSQNNSSFMLLSRATINNVYK